MKKLFMSLVILAILATIAPNLNAIPEIPFPENTTSTQNVKTGFEEAKVVRVVDGDTIVVRIGETESKVRMIGVDTPESVASKEYLERTGKENTDEGKTASEYTKSMLPPGTIVYLEKDVSDADRYGRLLRYIWLEVPEDPSEEIEKMYNAILVEKGYANVVAYKPDTKYHDLLKKIGDKKNSP